MGAIVGSGSVCCPSSPSPSTPLSWTVLVCVQVVGAHSYLDAFANRQVTIYYADNGTDGDLVSYSLLPDGSRNESSQFRQTFYDVRKTPWFSLASPGPPKWAPLRFASVKNDLGQLPYIAIQTHMINVTTVSGEVPLVLASTLYVTPAKYRAQFSNLAYDFTSYVVDGVSLNESQLILASAGTVRTVGASHLLASNLFDSNSFV